MAAACQPLENLQVSLQQGLILCDFCDGPTTPYGLESVVLSSIVTAVWAAYERFLLDLFSTLWKKVVAAKIRSWRGGAAGRTADPTIGELSTSWPSIRRISRRALYNYVKSKSPEGTELDAVIDDPTAARLSDWVIESIRAGLLNDVHTWKRINVFMKDLELPALTDDVFDFDVTFDRGVVPIRSSAAFQLLLNVFYGARCVFAHGDASRTLHGGVLQTFPNTHESLCTLLGFRDYFSQSYDVRQVVDTVHRQFTDLGGASPTTRSAFVRGMITSLSRFTFSVASRTSDAVNTSFSFRVWQDPLRIPVLIKVASDVIGCSAGSTVELRGSWDSWANAISMALSTGGSPVCFESYVFVTPQTSVEVSRWHIIYRGGFVGRRWFV